MPDPIRGARTAQTTYEDPTCDEKTGVCGAQPLVSTEKEGDCERDPSHAPCIIPDLSYRELAKNMGARSGGDGPALDALSWRELGRRVDTLQKKLLHSGDYSGKDVDQAMLGKLEAEYQRRKDMAPQRPPAPPAPKPDTLAPRASAGVENGSAHAKAVALGAKDGSLEIGAVSASAGGNNEIAIRAFRMKSSDPSGGSSLEVGGAKASLGYVNDDGSRGVHLAVQVTAASGEATKREEGNGSVTGGVGVGAGVDVSLGITPDGQFCDRFGLGPFEFGGCAAPAANAPAAPPLTSKAADDSGVAR